VRVIIFLGSTLERGDDSGCVVGNSYLGITSGLPVIQEFLRSIHTSRPPYQSTLETDLCPITAFSGILRNGQASRGIGGNRREMVNKAVRSSVWLDACLSRRRPRFRRSRQVSNITLLDRSSSDPREVPLTTLARDDVWSRNQTPTAAAQRVDSRIQ
jgi:hypothetical protein